MTGLKVTVPPENLNHNPDSVEPQEDFLSGNQETIDLPGEIQEHDPTDSYDYNPEVLITESLIQLINLMEEIDHPEKTKIIGKLKGAFELFNSNN